MNVSCFPQTLGVGRWIQGFQCIGGSNKAWRAGLRASDLLPLYLMVENRSLQNSSDSRLQLVFLGHFWCTKCLSTFSSLKGFLHSFLLAPQRDLLRQWLFSHFLHRYRDVHEKVQLWTLQSLESWKTPCPLHCGWRRSPLHRSPAVAERWFPAGAVLPARGHWTMPGDIFGCHNWPLERRGRDVVKQHTMHRTAPQQWILRTTNWNISTTNNWETISERSPNLSWPFEEASTKASEKLNKTKVGTNLLSWEKE